MTSARGPLKKQQVYCDTVDLLVCGVTIFIDAGLPGHHNPNGPMAVCLCYPTKQYSNMKNGYGATPDEENIATFKYITPFYSYSLCCYQLILISIISRIDIRAVLLFSDFPGLSISWMDASQVFFSVDIPIILTVASIICHVDLKSLGIHRIWHLWA